MRIEHILGAPPVVRRLGRVGYIEAWRAMQAFTVARGPATPDELWLLEHPPVYTVGLCCRNADFGDLGPIPLVRSDRGGRITYHGPGQVVVYALLDLRRRLWGVRRLVDALEQTVVALLADYGLRADTDPRAPGVYVDGRKIASIGLRVRGGRTYHGLSLNVCMDLAPFRRIAPCGRPGLQVTQLAAYGVRDAPETVAASLGLRLQARLGAAGAAREDDVRAAVA